MAFDIQQGWELLDSETPQEVDRQLQEQQPELLVCSPECKHWGDWYRLNRHHLPLTTQIKNKRVAKAQADFCINQLKKQLRRGGRVLVEHPWSSDLWKYPPMSKLLQSALTLHKSHRCAYDLTDPDNGKPILKTTGLAVSHDMTALARQCPGHETHQLIAGHVHGGESVSVGVPFVQGTPKRSQEFVRTWMSCIRPHWNLCLFAHLQDETTLTDHEKPIEIETSLRYEVCCRTSARA